MTGKKNSRVFVFDHHLIIISSVLLKSLSSHISIFFVMILKDDIVARRESLIKGLCVYLNENPDILVQEYMVSVVCVDCGFATFQMYSVNHKFILGLGRPSSPL